MEKMDKSLLDEEENFFWQVNLKTQTGSWMWRKMLKLRNVAKVFYMKEIGNGRHTSHWYEKLSARGVLSDLLGERGVIDMGIRREATVEEATLCNRRRRRHRVELLNDIEADLNTIKGNLSHQVEDVSLWRRESGYKRDFLTRETWNMLRDTKATCDWARGILLPQSTPKFAFMTWLATLKACYHG